ncbi:predicted protein [Nematostella vectensis]|uniref:Uncharacterized protein n=1 Tax=Nematostella vectensis TaxID=45351 RepID=A7SDR2_NEMVE|nr:predicted protein [Nematostella vectensis]|eukprot:XP_001630184.1 predicted protein [Nematostella vectensis]
MYLDPDRRLYHAFGLKRSVFKSYNITALMFYAEQKRAGRKLTAVFENDDPLQMGGDFIINCHGNMTLIHQSKFSLDRPSLEELKESLKSDQ